MKALSGKNSDRIRSGEIPPEAVHPDRGRQEGVAVERKLTKEADTDGTVLKGRP